MSHSNRKEFDLTDFYEESGRHYIKALSEVRKGRKVTHWIWYIFPQLRILGQSDTATHFGIHSVAEAQYFIADEVLGPRLIEISKLVVKQLEVIPLRVMMGSETDAYKLRSCATLFFYACSAESKDLFEILMKLCECQLRGRDNITIDFCEKEISAASIAKKKSPMP
jgi:uncharacterized protein (DUF1810 family)